MKIKLTMLLALTALAATAETYTLVGDRYLRLYTAAYDTPVYNASVDAYTISRLLCNVPWTHATVEQATVTDHNDDRLDDNVGNRQRFDAALFCAGHADGNHRAYANAACYRYRLPTGTLPALTQISVNVYSDPYNAYGARVTIYTNESGEIPTECATVRGNAAGSIVASNVAVRVTKTVSEKNYWYPNSTNLVFTADQLGASGLQLQRYLYVFVTLENYAQSNGNWLDGSCYIDNDVKITTSDAVPGWTDGASVNLFVSTSDDDNKAEAQADGKMAYTNVTGTVITYKAQDGTLQRYFTANEALLKRLYIGSSDTSPVTHNVWLYGDAYALGTATNLTAQTLAVAKIETGKTLAVVHGFVKDLRGFEAEYPVKAFETADYKLVDEYLAARGLAAYCLTYELGPDTDGDSIPDGWELYAGLCPTNAADAAADQDRDTLTAAAEYDMGRCPTDPFALDTDGDAIRDDVARFNGLKGNLGDDSDGDGLPNYAEYLATNVFGFGSVDPFNAYTVPGTLDYFQKIGSLYLGDIFTDHDMVDDAWEDAQGLSKCSRYLYDAHADNDFNGWDTWSEYAASVLGLSTNAMPSPKMTIRLRYNGTRKLSATKTVVVLAYSASRTFEKPGRLQAEDAAFVVASGAALARDGVATISLGSPVRGALRQGKTTFLAYVSMSGTDQKDGGDFSESSLTEYSPSSDPFGVALDVDVGFAGGTFDLEVTDSSPIMPRLFFEGGAFTTDDASRIGDSFGKNPNSFQGVSGTTRVRILRAYCDGNDNIGGTLGTFAEDGYANQIVYDGYVDFDRRPFFTEADILASGVPDIDWNDFQSKVMEDETVSLGYYPVTNVTYRMYFGEGEIDTTTNGANYIAFSRNYRERGVKPTVESVYPIDTILYNARPTFKWSITEDPLTAKYKTSYTAFRLKVNRGSTTVYDSGIQPLPVKDSDGYYTFSPALYVGEKIGLVPLGWHTWTVTCYNAKDRSGEKSSTEGFDVTANDVSPVNDNGYSTIDVCAKYFGAGSVSTNSTLAKTLYVEAFETPDFAGDPVSRTYVTTNYTGTDAMANATLRGLKPGTYYVRAYLDSDGDKTRDAFESWGYANYRGVRTENIYEPKPVTIASTDVTPQLVSVFVEDADTDNDNIPDAWEYDEASTLGAACTSLDPDGKVQLKQSFYDAFTNGTKTTGLSTGLKGALLSVVQDDWCVAQMLMPHADLALTWAPATNLVIEVQEEE